MENSFPNITIQTQPEVKEVFDRYPEGIRSKMNHLRSLILSAAEELPDVMEIEESLKWGEPSYATKKGSPIRIDWKERSPDTYAIYFNCSSKLVPTFRTLFADLFHYEGNRALHFGLGENTVVDKVTIRWPNGPEEEFDGLAADQIYTFTENGAFVLYNITDHVY